MGKSIVWNDAKFYRYFNMSVYFTQLLMFSIFFLYWKYVMFISTDYIISKVLIIMPKEIVLYFMKSGWPSGLRRQTQEIYSSLR